MVVAQVGKVVREVGEVVTQAQLEVVAEVPRHHRQRASAGFIQVRHIEHARLDKNFPVLPETVVTAQHIQARQGDYGSGFKWKKVFGHNRIELAQKAGVDGGGILSSSHSLKKRLKRGPEKDSKIS